MRVKCCKMVHCTLTLSNNTFPFNNLFPFNNSWTRNIMNTLSDDCSQLLITKENCSLKILPEVEVKV